MITYDFTEGLYRAKIKTTYKREDMTMTDFAYSEPFEFESIYVPEPFIIFDSATQYIHPSFTDNTDKFVEAYQNSSDGRFRYRTSGGTLFFGHSSYWGANYGFKWKQGLKKGTAQNMYMEMKCDASGGYSYHVARIYAAKNLNFIENQNSECWNRVNAMNYATQSNYAGTTPWYYMDKTLIQIPLSNVGSNIFYIGFHKCDCGVEVTKIYFDGQVQLV